MKTVTQQNTFVKLSKAVFSVDNFLEIKLKLALELVQTKESNGENVYFGTLSSV